MRHARHLVPILAALAAACTLDAGDLLDNADLRVDVSNLAICADTLHIEVSAADAGFHICDVALSGQSSVTVYITSLDGGHWTARLEVRMGGEVLQRASQDFDHAGNQTQVQVELPDEPVGACGGDADTDTDTDTDTDVDSDSDTDADCDALLADAGEAANKCTSGTEEQCEQAFANPTVSYLWMLMLDDWYIDDEGNELKRPDEELQQRRSCIADLLRESSAEQVKDDWNSPGFLSAVATGDQVRPALELKAVQKCNVLLTEDQVEACATLDLDACAADAFCWSPKGRRFDADRQCLEGQVEVGCTGSPGCEDMPTWAVDPDGACWWFPNGCIPQGPGWQMAGHGVDDPCADVGGPDCE